MAGVEYVRTLFAYNDWADRRVLAAAEHLQPGELTEPAGLSHGSILGTLVHVFAAERIWRLRCEHGLSVPGLPSAESFPGLAALRAAWDAERAVLAAYVGRLDTAALRSEVAYRTTGGAEQRTPLWQALVHVVNHGTQFRAEAAVALSRHGASPGDLDFIAYVRQHP